MADIQKQSIVFLFVLQTAKQKSTEIISAF